LQAQSKDEMRQNHEKGKVRDIGKGEALHGKYKKVELSSGQTFNRSSD
jgi:hypothetical protein